MGRGHSWCRAWLVRTICPASRPAAAPQPYASSMFFDSAFAGMLFLTLPVIFLGALYWVIRIAVRDGMREGIRDGRTEEQMHSPAQ